MEIAEENYTKELKKATYYVNEIADSIKGDIKEEAQEKICEINKTLENRPFCSCVLSDLALDWKRGWE